MFFRGNDFIALAKCKKVLNCFVLVEALGYFSRNLRHERLWLVWWEDGHKMRVVTPMRLTRQSRRRRIDF